MDKLQKVLQSLSKKESEAMDLLMIQLKRDYRNIPGMKALQGMKGWFRVRMGQYRIIFFVDPKTKTPDIRRISRRNESTYKNL